MVIEQTVEIPAEPSAGCLHLDLPLPEDHPSGRAKVEVRITGETEDVSGHYAEFDGGRCRVPTEEEARIWREPCVKNDTRLQEILKAASEKAEARQKDPSLGSLKKWHGVLENSKAWGRDVDVVAKIRAMRDEWPPEKAGSRG
ncbi:MAG: hypothetical protein LBB77_05430 [Treponema sp.]|jgi:hypothetical protein|nr:hypothetical protein [Treponema sp.]